MEDLSKYHVERTIFAIDIKSFFASVECVLYNLDPFKTPLVVADQSRGGGSIVLAVTPYLKTKGVPSRLRVYELPKNLNIIYAKPRMSEYIKYSTLVINIYLEFVSEKDIYVYSIDEVFLDVTNYLSYYQVSEKELAQQILDKITKDLKLHAVCGIGSNMLLAKLAMDLEAKENYDSIAKWDYKDVKEKLWPITPLSKMWGIGYKTEANLNKLGISKVGDIAKYSKEVLKRKFGILGLELWYHSHGIDLSLISDQDKLSNSIKSYSVGQVLFKDYYYQDIKTIILEMTDDVTRRLRLTRKKCKTINLGVMYSRSLGGFNRQITVDLPTNQVSLIYQELINLLDFHYENLPIRKISISLSNLVDYKSDIYSLFDDVSELEKSYRLEATIDLIKERYGKNSITRAVSETEEATAKKRNNQIGGHHV